MKKKCQLGGWSRSVRIINHLLVAWILTLSPVNATNPAKPNIIYILADDLGYGDVKCYNPQSKIPTPNLDRLAAQGMRFTDAHAPNAVCTPTRYALLTGRYAFRSRLQSLVLPPWGPPLIEDSRLTVPALLKDHGYATACIGKWHLGWNWPTKDGQPPASKDGLSNVDFTKPIGGGPTTSGFDSYFGVDVPNFPPYCFIENDRTIGIPSLVAPRQKGGFNHPGPMVANWNLTNIMPELTKRAVQYIEDAAAVTPNTPFFLYFPITAPHYPVVPSVEFKGRSQAGDYGDFVAQVDSTVGEVMAVLDRTGFAKNTLIIFTSDNGPEVTGEVSIGVYDRINQFGHRSMGNLRGVKRDVWEGGHRVPFIARWPHHIPAGAVSEEVICQVDFMATCAALVGAQLPTTAGEDSYNILPVLLGQKPATPVREATVFQGVRGSLAIRQGDWVLIDAHTGAGSREPAWFKEKHGYATNKFAGELFNLRDDLAQKNNLYDKKPEIVQRLKALLEKYKSEGRSAPVAKPPSSAHQTIPGEPQVYKTAGNRDLKIFLVKPDGWKAADQRPAMVLFHGGGWTGGSPALIGPQAEYFASRGMVCALVEYRLLKGQPGAPPTDCIQDAKSAMRWVRSHARELGIDPQRIGAAGGSAGGHLAAFTGMVDGLDDPADDLKVSPKPAAMVLFNPVFNNGPGQYGHDRVGERFKEFSPAHNITSNAPPTIVFLGAQDKLITVKTVEDFKTGMESVGVRCEARFYEGVGHAFFNREPYRSLTLIEADKFLASLGWLQGAPTISAPIDKNSPAAPKAEAAVERDARLKWWREARFGMFVHWGLYSGLAGNWDGKVVGTKGGMEWLQNRVGADTFTYASNALPLFQPKPDFASEWARVAKEAGCRYVVFTTKHHDGFSLHDSQAGDFDAGSRLNRDLVKEIVTALRAEGLRVGFYHSVIDWHHDQYGYTLAKGLPYPGGNKTAMHGERDHARYVDYLHAQVNELVSNYGTVDILWWDYSSKEFQGDVAWRASDLLANVRTRQPNIIMNNRLFRTAEAGWVGNGMETLPKLDPRYGDFITPEQHIPATGMPGIDWETCMTMNTTWGFNAHDHAWKSDETFIRNLVDIASKGGNYLLNIGPTGDGSVPPESVKSLHAIGAWMKVNGESIYGTTANPFGKLAWGTCTKKIKDTGGTLYLHLLHPPADGKLVVPGFTNNLVDARLLGGGKLRATANGQETVVHLPEASPLATNSVIALDFTRRLAIISH